MATQILDLLMERMSVIMLVGMLVLIVLSALQLSKMSRTNRQLKYLTEKLAGDLKAVLEDEEEEDTEEEPRATEFVSRQEQNMREAIEQQKQQKKMKDAQVFDAVLSEIFP